MSVLKTGVLVNANARRHKRGGALVRAYEALTDEVAVTTSLDDLPKAVRALQHRGVDTVAISGGDGAVHRGLSAVVREWDGPLPSFALLPAGTMNTVARGLGVRGGPARVLERVATGQGRRVVRRPIDAEQGRVGFLVGTGFWARFLSEYDARSGPGAVRAAGVLARGLASTLIQGPFVRALFESVPARVSLDGELVDGEQFTMVAAGAVPSVGLGFAPFTDIDAAPNAFHALAFQSRPAAVARQLPSLYRGGAPRPPDVGRRVQSLVIEAERPFTWAIDGDVQPETDRLVLSPGPELTLLT